MTEFPPPLDYQSVYPDRSDSLRPTVVAWVIILICVIGQMTYVARQYREAKKLGLPNPSSELQVSFSGKTAVGFNLMLGGMNPTTAPTTKRASRPELDQYIDAMDKYSATPADRVRTIAAVGELKGADAALKRIELEESKAPDDATKEDLAALRTIYQPGPEALDADARQRLIDRHGFFGRLAVSYEAKPDDPIRKVVIADAQRATVVAIVLVAGLVALAIVVLAAVITAIVLAALGKFKRGYVPNPLANSAFLEAFALSLVLLIGASLVFRLLHANSLAWEWVMLLLIPIMMMWIRMRGVASPEERRGLGWYRGRGLLVEMACGLFGYFAGIPIIVAGIFISLKLSKYAGASPMHPIQKMLQGNAWQILNLYIAACVIAPVLEETMFRGSLFNHLRRRWGWLISASVVAFIFAAIHPQGWTLIPGLGSIAIVLAAIREWRGSLWGSIAAHAANNGIVLTLALMVAR